MVEKLKAIYRDGIFIPDKICNFPQNTIVELTIKPSRNVKTEVIDPEARQQILKTLLERMRQTVASKCSESE
ncbi:hypothetical protein [Gloeothece verrucosa]|uniref:DUF104 domain-containing protein n=1 Tax=Gloeothece verrucosa (strain PCC 7822) TaxID=497965 RepID=E0UBB3_GLOV7|nr:hypothetical protein [Gloeothece verrucosa]ADN17469.1 conserved hypothetical protein [Gloeothece verrucosa PCC 7822]